MKKKKKMGKKNEKIWKKNMEKKNVNKNLTKIIKIQPPRCTTLSLFFFFFSRLTFLNFFFLCNL